MARIAKPSTKTTAPHRSTSARLALGRLARHDRDEQAFARNIYSQLAGRLGQEIVAGLFPPGSVLPNAARMCERFSVSRTALREAYSILSAKALIVARPKIGTRVRPKAEWNLLDPEVLAWHLQATPSARFVDDLFVLRQMVEPPAAALGRVAEFARHDRSHRRGVQPHGSLQERRRRPDRRRSRFPHGDSRSDGEPVLGGARRPYPHRARMHLQTELAGRRPHPRESTLSAPGHFRSDTRRRGGSCKGADGGTVAATRSKTSAST